MVADEGPAGPLSGLRVIELAGIGPAPMCAMLLADLGADVLRIERTTPSGLGVQRPLRFNLALRGRPSVSLDLKSEKGKDIVLKLVGRADALIEGFRPGVTERLGLGPEVCLERNPGLVYGRVTGWGQSGPLAKAAGHDLNYIALTGALAAIGRKDGPPTPPLNLVGDFGGGALYLAFGILAALHERHRSGKGQVVDAAIVDGVASMMTQFYGMAAAGLWSGSRGSNALDSGAPFYDVYECADGRYMSVAPIEHKFLQQLIERMKLPASTADLARDPAAWPALRKLFGDEFRRHPLRHWCEILEGFDTCASPVLTMAEASSHEHIKARETLVDIAGIMQPAPTPRFSRSRTRTPSPPQPVETAETSRALKEWLV